MNDEETVEAILDKAADDDELHPAYDCPNLRAALLKLVRSARQPVAHEVPGFHVTYPAWSDCIGNAMPFTPFQADEPGPGFICGESFLRESLPKFGMTPDQIETYIAGLPRLRMDEEDDNDAN
jgi:hypothetical protein